MSAPSMIAMPQMPMSYPVSTVSSVTKPAAKPADKKPAAKDKPASKKPAGKEKPASKKPASKKPAGKKTAAKAGKKAKKGGCCG